MHYLRFVIDDRVTPGPADEPGAVDAFNYQLKTDGSWVFAGSLTSPNDATVADNRSGDVVFTDGPFVEFDGVPRRPLGHRGARPRRRARRRRLQALVASLPP